MSAKHLVRQHLATILYSALAIALLMAIPAHGQTYSVVGNITNGSLGNPSGQTVQGRNSDVYVVSPGNGWLFSATTTGTFAGVSEVGGPSGVTLGTNGDLYTNFVYDRDGCGEVDQTTPAGTYTVLATLCGTDGSLPYSAPIQAASGIFYGTASEGGTDNEGTIYSMTSSGTVTLLHSFVGTDGSYPYAQLVVGSDGNLYGGTSSGGTNNDGVLFKITPQGTYTVLHNLEGSDGQEINDGLCLGSDGNLYGVTYRGGDGSGVIFKLSNGGVYTVLYNIPYTYSLPGSGLVQASDGKLYGVIAQGNSSQPGWIYNITTGGTFSIVYQFCQDTDCSDGIAPSTPLIQHTNGLLYGFTVHGGDSSLCDDVGCGVMYSLNIGAKAFAALQTTSGKEGAKIGILGQGFTSATVVKFGGTEATTVTRSGSTYLTATVPADALTGSVTVTTGATVLTSSKTFDVLPTAPTFSPTSGPVGTLVTITGTGLTQTTKVEFNGKSAGFTVVSDTEITATVPTGATTGRIGVTTKGGTVETSTKFTVN
ncbi:MAG TPA: choice-of-anchor tandem repeat GloVer-containing protein [Candidatus Sulfotelmatobacter sp.]|nr:choice-of-anchor tandem repeat GloVer-containing protein [Candidatus Sulfotelmatobacter sp.]